MTRPSIDDATYKQIKFLKYNGLWPSRHPTTTERISKAFTVILGFIFVFMLLNELFKDFKDMTTLSGKLSITTSPTAYTIKLVIFLFQENAILSLVDQIHLKDFQDYPENLDKYMTKTINLSQLLAKLYQWFCAVVIILYSVMPLIYDKEYPVSFSYDVGPYKPVIYIIQVLGLASAASNNSCFDVLGASLMGVAAAQIDILNENIQNFAKGYYKQSNTGTDRKSIKLNLQKCIIHHSRIITFIKSVEKIYTMMVLVQFLSSAIVICNIGFQLTHIDPYSLDFTLMVFYFNAMMFQLVIYCWFGHEIIEKSMNISNSCFKSDWTNCDEDIQKCLVFIMMRSDKPLALTIGGFSNVSLISFTSVIRNSYSYFALMQRISTKNEHL